MVVVGSRCQVRKSVFGWKAASSRLETDGVSGCWNAPSIWPDASPASEAPRKARRVGVNMDASSGRETTARGAFSDRRGGRASESRVKLEGTGPQAASPQHQARASGDSPLALAWRCGLE